MLDFESARVLPVVEDLGSKHMPANTPHSLVALVRKPLMSNQLCIKVFHFVRRVVDIRLGVWLRSLKEETVVVRVLGAQVKVEEYKHIHVWIVCWVQHVRRDEIEGLRVEGGLLVEIFADIAAMAELVDQSGPRAVSLELSWVSLAMHILIRIYHIPPCVPLRGFSNDVLKGRRDSWVAVAAVESIVRSFCPYMMWKKVLPGLLMVTIFPPPGPSRSWTLAVGSWLALSKSAAEAATKAGPLKCFPPSLLCVAT